MTTQNGRAFNEWLRAQLKAKKMSQRQLAQQSGVDHSTISRLIRGDRMPSLGTATKLARGLRELRDDADTPQYLGPRRLGIDQPDRSRRVRPAGGRAPLGAAGPPDHGVLPRRPDAPLRPRVPGRQRYGSSSATERGRAAIARGAGRASRPLAGGTGRRHGPGAVGGIATAVSTVRSVSRDPRPGARPLLEHFQGTTRIALHRPGLGDSERRRLGRRRSHVRRGISSTALRA